MAATERRAVPRRRRLGLARRLACPRFAVLRLACPRLVLWRRAVERFAVLRLAPWRLVRLAALFLAPLRRARPPFDELFLRAIGVCLLLGVGGAPPDALRSRARHASRFNPR